MPTFDPSVYMLDPPYATLAAASTGGASFGKQWVVTPGDLSDLERSLLAHYGGDRGRAARDLRDVARVLMADTGALAKPFTVWQRLMEPDDAL